MKRFLLISLCTFSLIIATFIIYSCKHEIIYPSDYGYPGSPYGTYTPVLCDTNIYTFSGAILPVIQYNCFACHGNSNPISGISLTTYNVILFYEKNGELMCDINQTTTNCPNMHPMPKAGSKLSNCIITQFNKWIENGAQNN